MLSLMRRTNSMSEYTYNRILTENMSLLNEAMTIEKAKTVFNTIPNDTLQTLITMDPTYREGGNNVGKLLPWIANSYLRDSSIINDPQESRQILTIFKDNQNRFDRQSNIKDFQTIAQVRQFLSQQGMLGGDNNNDPSNNIDNAEVRKGTKTVLNGNTWLIVVPMNYAAERHWGANTNWCTAADNGGSYYEQYLKNHGGQYYILINKNNPSEKYQFHFESHQFMDSDDNQIGNNVYDLDDYDELDGFFSAEKGPYWAYDVTCEEDMPEDWVMDGTFSHNPPINILYNMAIGGEYLLQYDNGEDACDERFSEIDPIDGDTGLAMFIQGNEHGLLCINNGSIEKYADGFDNLTKPNFMGNGEWFYIGKKGKHYALITKHPETMETFYNSIIPKSTGENNMALIVDTGNGIGIMRSSFKIEQRLYGNDVVDTWMSNAVIIKCNQGEGSYFYNVETEETIHIPLEGQIRLYGYYAVGYVGTTINVYNVAQRRFLFGKPLEWDGDISFSKGKSGNSQIITYRISKNRTIDFNTFGGVLTLYEKGKAVGELNEKHAYEMIANSQM